MSIQSKRRVLATEVEYATTRWQRFKGLMFRRSIPPDYALVFDEAAPTLASVTGLGLLDPVDVVWLLDGVVVRAARLSPWELQKVAWADTVVELGAGEAANVAIGDQIEIADVVTVEARRTGR